MGLALSKGLGATSLDASLLYQQARQGAQETRFGHRLFFNLAASHRLGGEKPGEHAGHKHTHVHVRGRHAFDAILELNGDWQGREKVAGRDDGNSGGTWLYLAPGVRYISPDRWAASASLGLPVWQRLNGVQAPVAYRMVAEVGKAF